MPTRTAPLLFTILAVAQFVATAAVAEPSFEETRDWIIDKIRKNSPYEVAFSNGKSIYETTNVAITPCLIKYRFVHFTSYDGGSRYTTTDDFVLDSSDIQRTAYKAGTDHIRPETYIYTYAASIKKSIRSIGKSEYSATERKYSKSYYTKIAGFTIKFSSEENLGDRLAKAITHLGKLAYANPDCPKHPRPKEVKQVF